MSDEKQDIVWTRAELCAEIFRLHSVNAALVVALEAAPRPSRSGDDFPCWSADYMDWFFKSRGAILTAARTGED